MSRLVVVSFFPDIPEPPFNLTIEALDSTSVTLTWKINERYTHSIENLELTVHSVPDGEMSNLQLGETTTHVLDGEERSTRLEGLTASGQYQVHMVAISTNNRRSNSSDMITFRTLPGKPTPMQLTWCKTLCKLQY